VALVIGSTLANVTINPVALAGIVFVFGLIPLIGNTLAAALVIVFCLFASSGLAVGMAIYFLLYQQIENATLQPYIQARSNNLTPLIVFISALIGAQLGGLLGALAAIPLAGCIRVLLDEYSDVSIPLAEELEKDSDDKKHK
jgi:predicted PurR-regulated permease PerM